MRMRYPFLHGRWRQGDQVLSKRSRERGIMFESGDRPGSPTTQDVPAEAKAGKALFEDAASHSQIDQVGFGVNPTIAAQIELGLTLRWCQAVFDGLDADAQAADVARRVNQGKARGDAEAQ